MSVQQKRKPRHVKILKNIMKKSFLKECFTLIKQKRELPYVWERFISRGPHKQEVPKCNQKIDQAAEKYLLHANGIYKTMAALWENL